MPLVKFAAGLGWLVTVADHRPAYLEHGDFSAATRRELITYTLVVLVFVIIMMALVSGLDLRRAGGVAAKHLHGDDELVDRHLTAPSQRERSGRDEDEFLWRERSCVSIRDDSAGLIYRIRYAN